MLFQSYAFFLAEDFLWKVTFKILSLVTPKTFCTNTHHIRDREQVGLGKQLGFHLQATMNFNVCAENGEEKSPQYIKFIGKTFTKTLRPKSQFVGFPPHINV